MVYNFTLLLNSARCAETTIKDLQGNKIQTVILNDGENVNIGSDENFSNVSIFFKGRSIITNNGTSELLPVD